MKFSIPYINGMYDALSENDGRRAKHICDVYFSFSTYTVTGRGYYNDSEKQWNEISKIKSDLGIQLNYTWNPSVYHPHVYINSSDYVNKLYELYERGIDILTLSSPFIIKNEKYLEVLSKFKIRASVLNYIDSLEKIIYWNKYIGVDSFVLYGQINRNYDEIKRISEYAKKYDIETSLLVNEGCLSYCPYRIHEFSLGSFKDCVIDDTSYEFILKEVMSPGSCLNDAISPAEALRMPNIGPSKIDIYKDYIDYMKLINKNATIDVMTNTLDAYIDKNDNILLADAIPKCVPDLFTHVTWNDLYKNGFFENTMNCKSRCANCSYCFDFYETNLFSIIKESIKNSCQKKNYEAECMECYEKIKNVIDTIRKGL